jgi:hypothetical protein
MEVSRRVMTCLHLINPVNRLLWKCMPVELSSACVVLYSQRTHPIEKRHPQQVRSTN